MEGAAALVNSPAFAGFDLVTLGPIRSRHARWTSAMPGRTLNTWSLKRRVGWMTSTRVASGQGLRRF